MSESRAAGALVLLDVKRGDIGSTSQAYADAYLDPASPLACRRGDREPLPRPRLPRPLRRHRAPPRRGRLRAGADLQQGGRRRCSTPSAPTGVRVADRVLDHLRALNAGAEPLGLLRGRRRRDHRAARATAPPSTWPSAARCWRPGFGAQGGTVADLQADLRRLGRRTCWPAPRATCCAWAPTRWRCATPCAATQRRAGGARHEGRLRDPACVALGPGRAACWRAAHRLQRRPVRGLLRAGRGAPGRAHRGGRRRAAPTPCWACCRGCRTCARRPRATSPTSGSRSWAGSRRSSEALEDADVDPATYDRGTRPRTSTTSERAAIDGAARELVRPTTLAALQATSRRRCATCAAPLCTSDPGRARRRARALPPAENF